MYIYKPDNISYFFQSVPNYFANFQNTEISLNLYGLTYLKINLSIYWILFVKYIANQLDMSTKLLNYKFKETKKICR